MQVPNIDYLERTGRREPHGANLLTETTRLRIPKVASQAEAREDGTHLIGLRTPGVLL